MKDSIRGQMSRDEGEEKGRKGESKVVSGGVRTSVAKSRLVSNFFAAANISYT